MPTDDSPISQSRSPRHFVAAHASKARESLRFIICSWPECRRQFHLCAGCDRGQRYCSDPCRQAGRNKSCRAARKCYRQSEEGRQGQVDRQRACRENKRLAQSVTDQGPKNLPTPISLSSPRPSTNQTRGEETCNERSMGSHRYPTPVSENPGDQRGAGAAAEGPPVRPTPAPASPEHVSGGIGAVGGAPGARCAGLWADGMAAT